MRLDPQFLPMGDDFPEPHMDNQPRTWADMTYAERLEMHGRMIAYGGSFVRRLGGAFVYADPANAHKLAAAFPELVQAYGPQWGKK